MNCESLLFELTQKCNLNCEYCFYRDYGRKNDELTPEQLERILSDYDRVDNIFFTGGECTLNSHFKDLLKIAKAKSTVTIFTNGIKLNDENFYQYIDQYIDKYIITFDDFEETYFCRKSIDETNRVIKKIAINTPDKLIVKICINKYNINKLEDIINYLISIKVKKISINFIHNIKNNDIDFEIDSQEKKHAFEILEKYLKFVDINYYDEIKEFLLYNKDSLTRVCKAGVEFFYYDCVGVKSFCPAECNIEKTCINKECISLFEMF